MQQYLVVKWFSVFVEEAMKEGGGLQPVLCRLAGLYAVWCLHRHSALLYQGMRVHTHTHTQDYSVRLSPVVQS